MACGREAAAVAVAVVRQRRVAQEQPALLRDWQGLGRGGPEWSGLGCGSGGGSGEAPEGVQVLAAS